jgi:L-seryl-tRNA(Ser) seleniumtransferase
MLTPNPVEDPNKNRLLRQLPSVEQLLSSDLARELGARHSRPSLARAARLVVQRARQRLLVEAQTAAPARAVTKAELEAEIHALFRLELEARRRPGLRAVINATGVVLHTGLGRAPLASAARRGLLAAAAGYSNLEIDLESGERGSRQTHLSALLTELTGAEAALVVNNCAGAVLLALSALAADRAAVVSRGEMVEIGGGFRMPEVMALGRVRLLEVGTTNKTRLQDYARVLGPEVSLIVKVHRSNFTLSGFTEEASLGELAALARGQGIPLFYDLGSGLLDGRVLAAVAPSAEPSVALALREGADLVAFSGDKLLGGPQAGILVGSRKLIRRLQKHPLQRALRLDKLTAAALEATLMLYRDGHEDQIPAVRLLRSGQAELRARADRLSSLLRASGVPPQGLSIRPVTGRVGGGSLPGCELASIAVAVSHDAPDSLCATLRRGRPAVVARVKEGAVLLDVRTVLEADLAGLARAVAGALAKASVSTGKGADAPSQGTAHA